MKNRLIKLFRMQKAKFKGVKYGDKCRFIGNINWGSEPYLISIGNSVSITSSNFITHDGAVWVLRNLYNDDSIDYLGKITICDNVFIGIGCIILPGSYIESNVIIGAGSIVKGNVKKDSVYAGTPAKCICSINEYYLKNNEKFLRTKKMSKSNKKKFLLEHYNI